MTSSEAKAKTVTVVSSDGVKIEVAYDVIKRSRTIRTMIEDLGLEDTGVGIPIANVDSDNLKKIISWATYHKDDPLPADDSDDEGDTSEPSTDRRNSNNICNWDKNFFNITKHELFDLVLAANFLDISDMLDTMCKTIANMIKGKKPEEIREEFNIENDLTKEDIDRINKEHEWCNEI